MLLAALHQADDPSDRATTFVLIVGVIVALLVLGLLILAMVFYGVAAFVLTSEWLGAKPIRMWTVGLGSVAACGGAYVFQTWWLLVVGTVLLLLLIFGLADLGW